MNGNVNPYVARSHSHRSLIKIFLSLFDVSPQFFFNLMSNLHKNLINQHPSLSHHLCVCLTCPPSTTWDLTCTQASLETTVLLYQFNAFLNFQPNLLQHESQFNLSKASQNISFVCMQTTFTTISFSRKMWGVRGWEGVWGGGRGWEGGVTHYRWI